jgi:predicted TIM-barrel fold metal-dependent hydrolase
MLTPQRCLEHLDSLKLDAETTRRYLGGNAARIFDLGTTTR